MSRSLVILWALFAAAAAQAGNLPDVICSPKADLVLRLEMQHGAKQLGAGMYSPEEMMEIWVSEATGDWTLVRSYANGTACIIAMGEHFAVNTPETPS